MRLRDPVAGINQQRRMEGQSKEVSAQVGFDQSSKRVAVDPVADTS
jgi:hypothetical protein